MLSKALEESLHRALALANARDHEFATLEHLLLALTEDRDAISVLRACGVDVARLRKSLETFVAEQLSGLALEGGATDAKPTASFQRVIQRAVHHVQMSGREEVTGANVLVAIFSERESHAVFYLHEQDMTRLDAVSYISHGIAKAPEMGEQRSPRGSEEDEDGDGEKTVKQGNDALQAYCRKSADPVGRLYLALHGIRDEALDRLSDRICTGLQLVNFLQDVAEDWSKRDRIYLTAEAMNRFGVREGDLDEGPSGPRWPQLRALLDFERARARGFLEEGLALTDSLRGRLAASVWTFTQAGLLTLDLLEAVDGDVWRNRPAPSSIDKARLLTRAIWWLARRGG